MKVSKIFISAFLFLGFISSAYAITPTFSLNSVNSVSGQVSVYGDANSAVYLYYGKDSTMRMANIGTTNAEGNLSTPVNVNSYFIECGQTAYVFVNNQQSPIISWAPSNCTTSSNSSGDIRFSKNNLTLNAGQSESITIYGAGGYYVSSNSNSNSVSVNFEDQKVKINGISFGTSKIKICGSDGECGEINVTVLSTNIQQNISGSQKPAIASISIFSDNYNDQFVSNGSSLTFGFNTNKPVQNVSVFVGNSQPTVSGSGSGTYMFKYTVPNNEYYSIPVNISFNDFFGNSGKANFSLGNVFVSQPSSVVATPSNNITSAVSGTVKVTTDSSFVAGCTGSAVYSTITGQRCPNSSSASSNSVSATKTATKKFVFSSFLGLNSSGDEVAELQKKLTDFGFYSGPVNGKFGPLTEAAVKKLQKANNIKQAGYVGPSTREVLNK